ncbi:MAG: hypothetical protein SF123_08375 [Chloroflexota bacterium]|nr:hypothetical protein [Chloroflexota bacterium]
MRLFKRLLLVLLVLTATTFSAAAQDESLEFISWTEPQMNLYSAEIPINWQINAGIVDFLGSPQPNIVLMSADSSIAVIAGLNQRYVFLEPNESLGLYEGDALPFGDWSIPIVQQVSPAEFLSYYLDELLISAAVCADIEYDALPELDGNRDYRAGEVTLECTYDAGVASGYFYVALYTIEDASGARFWMPGDLFGFLAEPGAEVIAQEALMRLAQTLTIDAEAAQAYTLEYQHGTNDMDALLMQDFQNQVDQMMRSHMVATFSNTMYWNCVNTQIINGGSGNC